MFVHRRSTGRRPAERDDGGLLAQREPSRQALGSPGHVLALQRAAGNAAVAGMRAGSADIAIQRYKSLARGTVDLPSKKKQFKREMFLSHLPEPTVPSPTEEVDWGHVRTAYPDLLASNDDTVVIQDTTKEPQEFYGSPAVVAKAQRVLATHGSLIGLEVGGASFDLAGQTLTRVKAKSNMVPVTARAADEIESILDHICINFANMVMGLEKTARSHELVLHTSESSGRHDRRAPMKSSDVSSDQLDKLAESMAASDDMLHKEEAVGAMASPGARDASTGESYGRSLGEGELEDSAKRLGVNEFAVPEVGEAYATYSIKTVDGEAEDFSVMLGHAPTVRDCIWGYHYAGVVAESEDGKDKVTLENYNRQGDLYDAFVNRLIIDFGNGIAIRARAAAKKKSAATDLANLYAELAGGSNDQKKRSADAFKEAMTKSFSQALRAWFFRMYGTLAGSGQTFHEKSAASGYFANPLTARVGAPTGSKYEQLKTRQFAQLAQVVYLVPQDYREQDSFVRPRDRAYRERTALADHVMKAGDEGDAKGRLKDGLEIMRDDQAWAHLDRVNREAGRLKVPARDLPRMPGGPAGYPAAFDQAGQACLDKASDLRFQKERKQALAQTANLAATVKAEVVKQLDYYERYVT